jgi:hypothetical protein
MILAFGAATTMNVPQPQQPQYPRTFQDLAHLKTGSMFHFNAQQRLFDRSGA